MMEERRILPVRRGQDLIADVDGTNFAGPGAAVWWLGQSGFIVKAKEGTVYIDPYLSEHLTTKYADTEKPHVRILAAPLRAQEVTNADVLLSTHQHSDHMDPETVPAILATSPQAAYILPRAHLDRAKSWGLDDARLRPADVDTPIRKGGIEFHPQPAAHEDFDVIEGVGYPYMGFVINMGGITFYHSGDTVPYMGMIERLRTHEVEVAFLPINGRDARRHALGTPGNCTVEEAVCIAKLAGVDTVVPHHYNMFTFNTVDIERFKAWAAEAFRGLGIRVMNCGEKYLFEPRQSCNGLRTVTMPR